MLSWLRPRNWWHAGLLYGTAMFVVRIIEHALQGELTLALAGKAFLVWEVAGLTFGIILTTVMSLLSHKNLFRGFPDKRGNR